MAKKKETPPAPPPPAPTPPATAPASANGRPTPFTAERHRTFAKDLLQQGENLMQLERVICNAYGKTTQGPRLSRQLVAIWEELRGAMNTRFFSERCSRDGSTPYYPPQVMGDAGEEDEEELVVPELPPEDGEEPFPAQEEV